MLHWKTAVRSVLRRAAFTAALVLVLGFAIGTIAVPISVVDAVLLKLRPYPQPDCLVQMLEGNPTKNQRESLIAPAGLAPSFEVIAGLLLGQWQRRERELPLSRSLRAMRWQMAASVLREAAVLALLGTVA